MRLSPLFLLPVAACAAAPVVRPPDVAKAPGRYVETFDSGGKPRRFILRVPKSYHGEKIPVVMVLHGWTASAEMAEVYTRMAEMGEKEGFVVAFPDGLGNPKGWNAGFIDLTGQSKPDDLGFLNTVLDRIEGEINVDRDREYVVGHSNGAFMANFMGAKSGGRLAAIASMAGTIGLRAGLEIPKPEAPLNVLLLHGKADTMVGYAPTSTAMLTNVGAVASAQFWAKADGCDPTPKSRTSADGKVVTDRYLNGKKGTEVRLVSVASGPHDWWGGVGRNGDVPSYGAPVADLVWEFFKTHPRKR